MKWKVCFHELLKQPLVTHSMFFLSKCLSLVWVKRNLTGCHPQTFEARLLCSLWLKVQKIGAGGTKIVPAITVLKFMVFKKRSSVISTIMLATKTMRDIDYNISHLKFICQDEICPTWAGSLLRTLPCSGSGQNRAQDHRQPTHREGQEHLSLILLFSWKGWKWQERLAVEITFADLYSEKGTSLFCSTRLVAYLLFFSFPIWNILSFSWDWRILMP